MLLELSLELLGNLVAELLRRLVGLERRGLHLLPVLVRAGEEHHLLAAYGETAQRRQRFQSIGQRG